LCKKKELCKKELKKIIKPQVGFIKKIVINEERWTCWKTL
jgi:hypothetical protein